MTRSGDAFPRHKSARSSALLPILEGDGTNARGSRTRTCRRKQRRIRDDLRSRTRRDELRDDFRSRTKCGGIRDDVRFRTGRDSTRDGALTSVIGPRLRGVGRRRKRPRGFGASTVRGRLRLGAPKAFTGPDRTSAPRRPSPGRIRPRRPEGPNGSDPTASKSPIQPRRHRPWHPAILPRVEEIAFARTAWMLL